MCDFLIMCICQFFVKFPGHFVFDQTFTKRHNISEKTGSMGVSSKQAAFSNEYVCKTVRGLAPGTGL